MKPSNFVQRFLLENSDIRGAIVKLTDVWQALHHGRDYPPVIANMLGEMAAVCTVIAGSLKQPGRLTFQMRGSGPLKLLALDCTEELNLRGYAIADDSPETDSLPVGCALPTLFGDGQLQLSLMSAGMEQPYQSIVPLAGNSVADVFKHYLEQSEQQPAGLWLACGPEASAGLFLQKLPGADEKDPDGWTRALTLAQTVRDEELLELDSAALLGRLFAEEDVRLYPARAVTHNWPRDPEKINDLLLTIGKEEVRAMLAEYGEVVICDELSNHTYRYGKAEIDALFRPRTLH